MSTSTSAASSGNSTTFTILLLGDLMIGRLIDALLPTSIAREHPESCPEDAAHTVDTYILPNNPQLKSYNYRSPWGNAVDLIRSSDGVLVNLETALTTGTTPWPGKVFNYRSHPGNVKCLTEVGLGGGSHKASTVQTLSDAGIEFAGAGRTKEEAAQPGIIELSGTDGKKWDVKCWSFSDHPTDWKSEECLNLIDYTSKSRDLMKRQIMAADQTKDSKKTSGCLGLKVVSMHWGPNYRWHPAHEIVATAHWLIDECDVDLIHGHSSHHVQGVEVYKGKLIVYGCGDFVDDYAVDAQWRNDLSAAWRVTVGEKEDRPDDRLEVKKLEVFPNRIRKFQANLLKPEDQDHKWVEMKFRELCGRFGTNVEHDLGQDWQLVVDMKKQHRQEVEN